MARITTEAKEQVRKGLVDAAARHFAQYGLDRANINTIALEAGFAKGTIYNYFSSKEELFGEVLAEACRRAVQRYSAVRHGDSVRDRLRALVSADVSVLRDEEDFMKVMVREAMSFRSATYPLILEHLTPFMEVVQDILTRGVERKEIRTDRPVAELTLLFVGTLALQFVQHWGSGGAWPSLAELPDLVVTAFLDGAAYRAPGGVTK